MGFMRFINTQKRQESAAESLPDEELNTVVRHYLIDTENMGREWLGLLDEEGSKMFHIFYTERSPAVLFEALECMLAKRESIRLVKCYIGTNALDFQLVTQLGHMIAQSPQDQFSIVSKDAGFDAVVKFWKDRGATVDRIVESGEVTTRKADELECLCRDALGRLVTEAEMKEVLRIIHSVVEERPIYYKTAVHTKLVKEFSQLRGSAIYQACKPVIEQVHCCPDLCLSVL